MKKVLKGVLIGALCLILAAAIVLSCMLFWHYPRFAANRRTLSIPAGDGAENKIMSYNLRLITPTDTGEKSWFYRAEYVLKDIEQEAPGIIGFQEATRWQYDFLVESLPDHDSVITYRDRSPLSEEGKGRA